MARQSRPKMVGPLNFVLSFIWFTEALRENLMSAALMVFLAGMTFGSALFIAASLKLQTLALAKKKA